MKNINILTFGADAQASNMGCMALGRSFIALCEAIAKRNQWKIHLVMLSEGRVSYSTEWITVETIVGQFRKVDFYRRLNKHIKESDLIVDFTLGDSFTDIYGLSRFVTGTIPKYMAVHQKKKFVMGPQTIGPFNNPIIRAVAKNILKKTDLLYCRDELSSKYAEKVLGKNNILTTDVAFSLQPDFDSVKTNVFSDRTKIGINVSELLWYLRRNKSDHVFLKMNYREYTSRLIEYCLKNHLEVHLISHVINEHIGSPDDYTAAEELKKQYPQVIIAPRFTDPMQAKAYISKMDCFIGARMHATIGAVSMNVPTIPIAYSRKFTGLYKLLDYNHVIDATRVDTETALIATYQKLDSLDCMKGQVKQAVVKAMQLNQEFMMGLESLLESQIQST